MMLSARVKIKIKRVLFEKGLKLISPRETIFGRFELKTMGSLLIQAC